MKLRWLAGAAFAAVAGLVAAGTSVPASAAEIITLHADEGRYKIQGGFYPNYFVFLMGVPADTKVAWVDKPYWAIIDFHDGPQAGQSAIVQLKKTSKRSPQPEWCKTEGGEKFTGQGVTCLKGFDDYRGQLRFKVISKWADSLAKLPAQFSDRKIAEYPELPGRGEGEVLKNFDMHIIIE